MADKCPTCGNELFDVFFGPDKMFSDVDNKRCIHCNKVHVFKKKVYQEDQDNK